MTINLSTTASNLVGAVSYSWSYVQSFGTTLTGTSLTNGTSSVVFTFPNTITFNGSSATAGDYSFTFQCVATDSGVSACTTVRTIILYFNNIPATCNISLSAITVS